MYFVWVNKSLYQNKHRKNDHKERYLLNTLDRNTLKCTFRRKIC